MDTIDRIEYYDELAPDYDRVRFGTSYGQYIDALERRLLDDWLGATDPAHCVDLGCGTGRLLDYARTGVDASHRMLAEAAAKHPTHHLVRAELTATSLAPASFDAAICFHVLMHLDPSTISSVLAEAARIVAPSGRFIFDIPSAHRRRLAHRPSSGWHGDTSATLGEIRAWAGDQWRLSRWRGLMLAPIHRVPDALRATLAPFDELVSRTPLARLASYLVCELERV